MNKPYYLSDPEGDFMSDDDLLWLKNTIAKKGKGLTHYDLMCVFQKILPAGTYEECLWYLPIAFDYLLNIETEITLLEYVLYYLDVNEARLKEEQRWDYCVSSLGKLMVKSLEVEPGCPSEHLRQLSDAAWDIYTLLTSHIGLNHLWYQFLHFGECHHGSKRDAWEIIVQLIAVRFWETIPELKERMQETLKVWNSHFTKEKIEKMHQNIAPLLPMRNYKRIDDEYVRACMREMSRVPAYLVSM